MKLYANSSSETVIRWHLAVTLIAMATRFLLPGEVSLYLTFVVVVGVFVSLAIWLNQH